MEDEFDQLIKFFSLEQKEKEQKLDEIFRYSSGFFERYKHVMATGTESEKKGMRQKMEKLRDEFAREFEKSAEKTGLSSSEVEQVASDPKNFTLEQWRSIQRVREVVSKERKEMEKTPSEGTGRSFEASHKKPKKTLKKKRSNWMKS